MLKINNLLILAFLCVITSLRCHSTPEKKEIQYEVLEAGTINDSLSAHQANYKKDFIQWKEVYENCIHDSLFPDAFYLGLQYNVWIGSISNQTVRNVNREITILDTSGKRDVLDTLAVNKS